MVFSLKSVNHEKVKIPIGRLREFRLESFQACWKKNYLSGRVSIYNYPLITEQLQGKWKMKTQGIPVLSNQAVFHPVPILSLW